MNGYTTTALCCSSQATFIHSVRIARDGAVHQNSFFSSSFLFLFFFCFFSQYFFNEAQSSNGSSIVWLYRYTFYETHDLKNKKKTTKKKAVALSLYQFVHITKYILRRVFNDIGGSGGGSMIKTKMNERINQPKKN